MQGAHNWYETLGVTFNKLDTSHLRQIHESVSKRRMEITLSQTHIPIIFLVLQTWKRKVREGKVRLGENRKSKMWGRQNIS